MDSANAKVETLKDQIAQAEKELQNLKNELLAAESQCKSNSSTQPHAESNSKYTKWPLTSEEYKRYGRQMIVPNIGIQGQLRLKDAKVLIIGAGGLGCPAAAYIAGAGVGTLGLVDGDEVEISNLHRQIIHSTARVGMKKVDSAIEYLRGLNPNITYKAHSSHLTPSNASSIVSGYDLVLDCTDNPTSRYLISDICVLLQKPLVSASALRTDGQLIVLNSPALPAGNTAGGPCYRCVFPKPPPADSVVTCGDGGILGPVVGVMGVLQAVEAIKLITSGRLQMSESVDAASKSETPSSMLLYAANSSTPFRTLKMRSRRPGCFACSSEAGLTLDSMESGSLDYVAFCGATSTIKLLQEDERIAAKEYDEVRKSGTKHLLVDVREKVQFDICSIDGSINVPFSSIPRMKAEEKEKNVPAWLPEDVEANTPLYLLCRLGNDSQVVARSLLDAGVGDGRVVKDIKGGLRAWKEQVDHHWPDY